MRGHLVVEVAGARRTIAIGAVQEILRTGAIARVPGAPAGVRGLSAVRGRMVPVVDPVHGGPDAPPGAFLVVVAIDGRGVGVLVDRVHGVLDEPPAPDGDEPAPPAPPIDLARFARGAPARSAA